VLALVGCVLVVGTAAWFLFGALLPGLLRRCSLIDRTELLDALPLLVPSTQCSSSALPRLTYSPLPGMSSESCILLSALLASARL